MNSIYIWPLCLFCGFLIGNFLFRLLHRLLHRYQERPIDWEVVNKSIESQIVEDQNWLTDCYRDLEVVGGSFQPYPDQFDPCPYCHSTQVNCILGHYNYSTTTWLDARMYHFSYNHSIPFLEVTCVCGNYRGKYQTRNHQNVIEQCKKDIERMKETYGNPVTVEWGMNCYENKKGNQ